MAAGGKRHLNLVADAQPGPPAKHQRNEGGGGVVAALPFAGVVLFVASSTQSQKTKLQVWKNRVPGLGGIIVDDAASARACTHAVVWAVAAGGGSSSSSTSWAGLPACLQPGSAAAVQYVTPEWLEKCLATRRRQPEADFAPPAPHALIAAAAAGAASVTASAAAAERAAAALPSPALQRLPPPSAEAAAAAAAAPAAAGEAAPAGTADSLAAAAGGSSSQGLDQPSPNLGRLLQPQQWPQLPQGCDPVADRGYWDVLSYNLWLSDVCAAERMEAFGRLVRDNGYPTFLLLQELTHTFLGLLRGQPWFARYAEAHSEHPDAQCFASILYRWDSVASPYPLPPHPYAVNDTLRHNGFGRDLKMLQCRVGGTSLLVATTHIMHMGGGRKQILEMKEVLSQRQEDNILVAGDLNWVKMSFTDYGPRLPTKEWMDVWYNLHPGTTGHTWDTNTVYQKGKKTGGGARLDRVLARLRHWQPALIERVGQDPIPGVTRDIPIGAENSGRYRRGHPVWISDHIGLYSRYSWRGVPPGLGDEGAQ